MIEGIAARTLVTDSVFIKVWMDNHKNHLNGSTYLNNYHSRQQWNPSLFMFFQLTFFVNVFMCSSSHKFPRTIQSDKDLFSFHHLHLCKKKS